MIAGRYAGFECESSPSIHAYRPPFGPFFEAFPCAFFWAFFRAFFRAFLRGLISARFFGLEAIFGN